MIPLIRSASPQRPQDVVGEWPVGGPADVHAAVERGRAALPGWRTASAFVRSRTLHDAATSVAHASDDIVELMVREVGKPVTEARGEAARAVAILEFYAQAALDPEGDVLPPSMPGALLFTRRRPRGLVALITPWNFPVAIPIWKLAPALAWGNTVVLKPSPESTACAIRLGELLALPDGVLQVLPGDADTGSALVDHPGVDAVSFTGSAGVGRRVATSGAARGVPVQAEMGGQNPCIVLADADVPATAAAIAGSAMGYAGQKCTAARRVIAVGESSAGLTDALVASVEELKIGDPADADTEVGPLITSDARARVAAAVDAARGAGARLLTGGRPLDGDGDGWFFAPALVADVPDDQDLAREEVFGPVCALFSAKDVEEAVRLANGTSYGLVAAVFTRDLGVALDLATRLDAGLVRVNAPTTGVDFHAPFGGEKASGHGQREQGRAAREFYTTTATVTIAPPQA
jgi:alpha-ketoglutaric semialdehyde dehydrogenase